MKKILFLALAITSLWSCESVVDIDLPEHKPVLVMNGVLSTDSTLKVKITHSKSSLDNAQVQPITNATVTLMLSGGQVIGTLTHTGGGYYEMPAFTPAAGTQYVIEATAPNYDKITATDAIPNTVQIISYTLQDSAVDFGQGYYMAKLDLTFTDPLDKNYYLIEIARVDTSVMNSSLETISITPANAESGSEEMGLNNVLVNDEFFNGKSYTVSLLFDSYYLSNDTFFVPDSSRLQLNFKSVSRDLYQYERTRNLQLVNSGNPFAEPVRVHSNVAGGFGILGAYSTDTLWIK